MKYTGIHVLKPFAVPAAALALCAFLSPSARAQSASGPAAGLINISTPDIVAPQQIGFRADLRVFGGDENTTYFGAGIRYGLSSNFELGLGTSLSQFQRFTLANGDVVRHAGSDIEVAIKYSLKQTTKTTVSAEVGVGIPNTPAQTSSHLTIGLAGKMKVASGVEAYLNPRAVLIENNTILGLGMGAKAKLARQISLVADYTPILTGANTVDVTTGSQRSHDVYGAALRYSANSGTFLVDVGWTNGSGFTTGSSLTPGLGNSSAFYVSLNFKR